MKNFNNQNGSVLLVSMLVLMVLSLIGIVALDTTDIELMVTTNDRTYKEAFNAADGGGMAAIKVLRHSLDESKALDLPSFTYVESGNDFYLEAQGFNASDDASDLIFSVSETTQVETDIQSGGRIHLAGGGVEFAMGYGSARDGGSVGARFDITTVAKGPNNSSSQIYLEYINVLGTPGGL